MSGMNVFMVFMVWDMESLLSLLALAVGMSFMLRTCVPHARSGMRTAAIRTTHCPALKDVVIRFIGVSEMFMTTKFVALSI